MPKADLDGRLYDQEGNEVEFDLKAVRKAARKGEPHNVPPQARLRLDVTAANLDQALKTAENMAQTIYKRLGLETEITKLGHSFGNFFLTRNENFDEFVQPSERWRGTVFLTATLECRRCRREMPLFYEMARRFPEVRFGLVNMNAPHSKFHERVFGDMAGGDPDRFVLTAEGATPFTIVYTPDQTGHMIYQDYVATGKTEKPPAADQVLALLDRCFP
jgi:hypothetical protein